MDVHPGPNDLLHAVVTPWLEMAVYEPGCPRFKMCDPGR